MILAPETGAPTIKLDPIALLWHASGPVRLTVLLLLISGAGVWMIAVLKFLQTARVRAAERAFERAGAGRDQRPRAVRGRGQPPELAGRAHRHGARVARAGREPRAPSRDRRPRAGRRARARDHAHVDARFDRRRVAVHRPLRHGVRHHGCVHSHRSGEERVASGGGAGHRRSAASPPPSASQRRSRRSSSTTPSTSGSADLLDEIEASVAEWVLVFAPRAAEAAVPLTRPISHPPPAGGAAWGQ